MAVRRLIVLGLLFNVVLSLAAHAQTEPIAWVPNLEAAKAEAKQTGRLVLVHFWTEDCAPCVALERNVFSQPEVAAALKPQFVAVKLNANANPATASSMGVTRVPTDVIITPDGQVVGKLISPASPMACIAEMTQVLNRFNGQSGQTMNGALAAAPVPSQIATMPGAPQLNSVYAGLNLNGSQPISATTTPAPPAVGDRYAATGAAMPGATANQFAYGMPATPNVPVTANPVSTSQTVQATSAVPTAPGVIDNRYAQSATGATPYAGPMGQAGQAGGTATNQFAGSTNGAPLVGAAVSAAPGGMVSTGSLAAPGAATQGAPANFASNANGVAAAAPPDARQLPAGSPPLGFEGYCPVSMRGDWKWVPGNLQFGAVHRGRTYLFAGDTQRQQFLANPDYYSPALSGIDPVLAIEHRQQVSGRREHSIDYDNLFYMFSSEASLQQFTANPERYAASVRAAMGIQRGRAVR